MDSSGKVVVANIEIKKDPKPPGTHFQGTPMPYFMRIVSGTGLHAGYLPGYPASDVSGCLNSWRKISLGPSRSGPRSRLPTGSDPPVRDDVVVPGKLSAPPTG